MTDIMLYNITCSVRTSSLADIQALVFLLIRSQNVNWITRAQINPRSEKMQISFYINQLHLWNNSMFLEIICFFLFYSVHFSLFVYLFSFVWRTKRSKIWIFLFILFPIYLCPTNSLIKKKGTGVKTEQLKVLTWPHKNKGNKTLADFLNAPFSS